MKIVFMGTPDFAVPSLLRLIASPHEIALVVTQPDKKAGRGLALHASPVKELAERHNLPVAQPASVRDAAFLETLRSHAPDAVVVVAYGKILPPAVLETPRYGCVNVHASLLPRYRGAAPVNWAIINGETETGVSIMRMDEGMDTGDVLAQETVSIIEDDDALSVSNMLSVVGAQKLIETLDRIEREGEARGRPQNSELATYAPPLKKENGRIDWSRRTEELVCLVRGTYPWPGAYTTLEKGDLKIRRVEPLWPSLAEKAGDLSEIAPGTVALVEKDYGFAVRTGDGLLLIQEAQPAGKRPMSGSDLVNGHYVKMGMRLGG